MCRRRLDESLKKLETDYVDLLLLHWPNEAVSLAEQIGAVDEVRQAGKVRHIGVSNFNTALMAEAVKLSAAPIVTNQIEYHPYIDQTPVIEAARKAGMAVTGYYARAAYETLTTHIFDPDDPYINSDAVFGVKESLLAKFNRAHDPARAGIRVYRRFLGCGP